MPYKTMPTQEKAVITQQIMGMWEDFTLYLAKATWLFIAIFAVTTRLAVDRFKGIKTSFVQKACAYVMGVFVGWMTFRLCKHIGITSDNLRAVLVGCTAISANEILKAIIALKWGKIIKDFINNLIKTWQSNNKS